MDKDQYQEPEVAYEADEGITALASAVCVSVHALSFNPQPPFAERLVAISQSRRPSPQLPSREA